MFPSNFTEEECIIFHKEEIDFELGNVDLLKTWLQTIIEQENKMLVLLNFIFCTDQYLHQINIEYLNHDTYTDIITFPLSEPPQIEGDIFISIDRVLENAQTFGVSFNTELHRVLAHGVLHLCGYSDKTTEEIKAMRNKEEGALQLYQTLLSKYKY